MTTYFEAVKRSFANVTVTEDGVNTQEFLEAAQGAVGIFGLLEAIPFSMFQNSLTGNIKKVRDFQASRLDRANTLELLVLSEQNEKRRAFTETLLWLLRDLYFTQISFQESLGDQDQELAESFRVGHKYAFMPHHDWLTRHGFLFALKACPTRADFYARLGNPPEKVEQGFKAWLDGLESIVKRMTDFYEAGGHSKGFKTG